jgi:hypothetical protein
MLKDEAINGQLATISAQSMHEKHGFELKIGGIYNVL